MIIREGTEYGSLLVLGRDEENPHLWRVRWGCCGRELTVARSYMDSRSKTLPIRCRNCVLGTSPKAAAKRKRPENPPEEIYAAGLWWGPALGRLGPR